jgi:hypothetical protein
MNCVVTVEIFPKRQFFSLLAVLRCPGLEMMKITAIRPDDSSPDSRSRHNYKPPTYTSLRSLELRGVDCTQIGADFDVTKLPALTHITFYQCPTSIFLLSTLIPAVEDEVNIWPLLKVISLDVGSLDDSDVNGLCKVLSYRTQCGKSIECVKFDTILVDWIADGKYVGPLREHVHVETRW